MSFIRSVDNHDEVLLVHPNGEKRWLSVEVITERYIAVFWPLSGTYDIILADNTVIARSLKARKRGFCLWKSPDIEELRAWMKLKLGLKDPNDTAERMKRHAASMPNPKMPINPGIRKGGQSSNSKNKVCPTHGYIMCAICGTTDKPKND